MITSKSSKNINPRVFLVLFLFALFLSGVRPNDYFYWLIHIFPLLIGFFTLVITYRRRRFSDFTYLLILTYSGVVFEGAHFGSTNIPIFTFIREVLNLDYNVFDKFSSFVQGFMVAAIFREILLRRRIIRSGMWQYLIVVCFALSVSVVVSQLDWILVSLINDSLGFLTTMQSSVYDLQLNLFSAMLGAIAMLVFLSKVQYNRIRVNSSKS